MKLRAASCAGLVAALLAAVPAGAVPPRPGYVESGPPADVLPQQLTDVGVDEHLGDSLPLDLPLTDQDGNQVQLGDYFKSGRPVVVNLAYYACPMLCGLVMKGLTRSIAGLGYTPGREFDVVTVSIDPRETSELAGAKRASILAEVGKPDAASGWKFHTAAAADIARLARAVGFRYHWDEKGQQWAHPAVVALASPAGKLTRYLYGIDIPPSDLKLAVLEAGQGKVGSATDKLLLFCFRYDNEARGYVLFAKNLMTLGGAATLLALGAFLATMWRRERAR